MNSTPKVEKLTVVFRVKLKTMAILESHCKVSGDKSEIIRMALKNVLKTPVYSHQKNAKFGTCVQVAVIMPQEMANKIKAHAQDCEVSLNHLLELALYDFFFNQN